eukprot:TRINITY_DN5681_c0_g1_i3.p1 TRINITY_DN5681_c0_g1~~TRINITY_DN5681_c0_g1_i3.p1  ORF type:complete len:466 (+),score=72.40 TRINITY_DN5681_c0_g1_i3:204-1400(+)
MATFTPQEVQFLQQHGNAKARSVYLARWSADNYAQPSPGDLEGLRRFIRDAFVDNRWSAGSSPVPSASKSNEAPSGKSTSSGGASRRTAQPQPDAFPKPEPLSSILGPDIPKIAVGASSNSSHGNSSSSTRTSASSTKTAPPPSSNSSSLIDLLGDFGSTPVASASATTPMASVPSGTSQPSLFTGFSSSNTPSTPSPAGSSSLDLLSGIQFNTPATSFSVQPHNSMMMNMMTPMQQQQSPSTYGATVASFDPFSSLAAPVAPANNAPTAASTYSSPQAAWTMQMTNLMTQMQIPASMHHQVLNQLATVPPHMQAQYLQQIQRQLMAQQQQQQQHQQLFHQQQTGAQGYGQVNLASQPQPNSFFQPTPQGQPQAQFSAFSSASTTQRSNANVMSDFPF